MITLNRQTLSSTAELPCSRYMETLFSPNVLFVEFQNNRKNRYRACGTPAWLGCLPDRNRK